MNAVIFDLDGTLIDSAPDIHAAANKMLALEGYDPLSLNTITSFIGNGVPKLVERVLDHVGIDQTNHSNMLNNMMDIYSKASSDLTVLYPGVWPLLNRLKAKRIKIALCTNKPYAPTIDILRNYLLTDLFEVVIGGDSLPTKKPNPEPLLEAMRQLGETEVLYVGDSEVDYQTAQNANVPFAFYTGGYRKKPTDYFQECWHFDHFDQLHAALTSSKEFIFGLNGT